MHIKPSENIHLIGLDSFFNEIKKLYDKKKLPHKILLSGKKGLGKSTLAYHIINYILSSSEDFKYDIDKFNIIWKTSPINLFKIVLILIFI